MAAISLVTREHGFGLFADKKAARKSTNLSFLRLKSRASVARPEWLESFSGHPLVGVFAVPVTWERISSDISDHTVELSVFWHVIRGLDGAFKTPRNPRPEATVGTRAIAVPQTACFVLYQRATNSLSSLFSFALPDTLLFSSTPLSQRFSFFAHCCSFYVDTFIYNFIMIFWLFSANICTGITFAFTSYIWSN